MILELKCSHRTSSFCLSVHIKFFFRLAIFGLHALKTEFTAHFMGLLPSLGQPNDISSQTEDDLKHFFNVNILCL